MAANTPGNGTTSYVEIYSLVGEGGNFPVNATITYKTLDSSKSAIIDIPAFITANGKSIPAFQLELQQSVTDFETIKKTILLNTQNFFNSEGLIAPSFILKSTTKPQVTPTPTPEQVTEQTRQETVKKEEQQTVTEVNQTDAKITISNTPPNLKPQGADKLAIVLNKKRSEIKRLLIPIAISIATELGIGLLNTLKSKLPDTCLPQPELDKLIIKRNLLVNRLNNVVQITDTLAKTLTGVNLVIGIFTTLINTLKTSIKAANISLATFPGGTAGPPGIIPSTIFNLKDIQTSTTEKLNKASGVISSATLSISTLNAVLLKLIAILNSIDIVLNKCNTNQTLELTPLSPILLQLEQINKEVEQNNNQESYNGFILEIVEVPFSPTVNRRRAVAKNSQGIILLQTPLSFTTASQILIAELKLLIDSNNLKAN